MKQLLLGIVCIALAAYFCLTAESAISFVSGLTLLMLGGYITGKGLKELN